jgi:hypothetical protein
LNIGTPRYVKGKDPKLKFSKFIMRLSLPWVMEPE